jgi:signal transduction histidine kinase
VTAALVTGAILLLVLQQRAVVRGVERSARNRAADVAALARKDALPPTLTAANEDEAFTQVVNSTGTVVAASQNLRGKGPVIDARPSTAAIVISTSSIGNLDGRFRIATQAVDTPTGRMTVYAGDSLETASDATQHLATLLGIGLPLLVGLVALTTWRVTGRALRPVEAIRAEVASIGQADLHRRVPEPSTHDEVGRLARTMNGMLARLDDAADRQRRFVSDASHELQSPLTSLRARFEVNLTAKQEPDWQASEAEGLAEVTEMQRLIDDLLVLARLDAPRESPALLPVDLDDIVLREAERLRTRGRVTVDIHRVSAGQVLGDPDQLRRAVRNVLDNAERHAAHEVAVSVQEHGGTIEVRIVDDGSGVAVKDRERVFERFGRIDDARTRNGSGAGTGLGLAITREIVEAHGGRITVETGEPGACFVLRIPAADSSY